MYTWINCILVSLFKYKKKEKNIPSIIALNVEEKLIMSKQKTSKYFLI